MILFHKIENSAFEEVSTGLKGQKWQRKEQSP